MASVNSERNNTRRKDAAKSVIGSIVLIAMVGACAVAAIIGLPRLSQRAGTIVGAAAPTIQVEWPKLESGGTWLAEQFQEQVLDLSTRALASVGSPQTVSMSPDALRSLGEALEKSGWFVGRPHIERRSGSIIKVTGEWRTPAAVVRQADGDQLVSWDGRLMPVKYATGKSKLRAIEGVTADVPRTSDLTTDYTMPWNALELHAALELLSVCLHEPWAGEVAGIDAGTFAVAHRLEIITASGARVVWGGRPTKPEIGESSTAVKLGKLAMLARRYGAIDAGQQRVEIYLETEPLVVSNIASGETP